MRAIAWVLWLAVWTLGCPSSKQEPVAAPPLWDEQEDLAMRTALARMTNMKPEVAARLRRLDSRIHCGEYVDDVRGVGFIVGKEGTGFVLDAVGKPPKPSQSCMTYDDFIQEQDRLEKVEQHQPH